LAVPVRLHSSEAMMERLTHWKHMIAPAECNLEFAQVISLHRFDRVDLHDVASMDLPERIRIQTFQQFV
jgi:hypothetical protein